MTTLIFGDVLYGKVQIPDWLSPFLRIPEFVRLRGVRLSNVDSYQFKDFSPSRWEHSIGVASLALRCGERRQISEKDRVHLVLAALLHDVATPPFAHTMEYVLEGFDHELESFHLLRTIQQGDSSPNHPVFASQLPQFLRTCEHLSRQLKITIDPDEVARLVVGEGELGFLINGTLDLDNADNVTRACLHMGLNVDRHVPLRIADWLAAQPSAPLNLETVAHEAVSLWCSYRTQLYSAFHESSPDELGRQAFLQHLCRQAIRAGIPRWQLIWNTDEGFLSLLERYGERFEGSKHTSLNQLVLRYRMLEPLANVANIAIEDTETLRVLMNPVATAWLERELTGPAFEPFIIVNRRRFASSFNTESLLPPAAGVISVFKLGETTKVGQLPPWLQESFHGALSPATLRHHLSNVLRRRLNIWLGEKPWLQPTVRRKTDVIANLDAVGDWSFRLSRNETLHPYPSTFVHAIPACLIRALGIQGELIVDPFGGTGQTAVECIRAGGRAISSDVNSVACLVARARLSYLNGKQRAFLRGVTAAQLQQVRAGPRPDFELIEKWHHPDTLIELCKLRSYIQGCSDPVVSQFAAVAFSAILTASTARKGKQHGFFADNTPLPRGEHKPPYENAITLFLARLERNLSVVERFYSFLERSGRSPEQELGRARALHIDVTTTDIANFDLKPNSVAAIITSPPYLCMTDYSLGQRLSYYWLFPERLSIEHKHEIGARRRRNNHEQALSSYLDGVRRFAATSTRLLRPGGYLATVLGAPVAQAFSDSDVIEKTDVIMQEYKLTRLWTKWRPVLWHRNHGYSRLKEERIAVYIRS